MKNTVSRIVKTMAGVFAVICDDGNGPVGEGELNTISLAPVSGKLPSTAETLPAGWYLCRVARGLAFGATTNDEAQDALRALVAHPNSKYLGRTFPTFTKVGRDGRWANLNSDGTQYVGVKNGASPLGWTLVYFNGN